MAKKETTSTVDSNPHGWFWQVVVPYWRVYRDVMAASFLVNLLALVSPLFVMNVYDRIVPNQAFETLWMLATGVLIAFLFESVIRFIRIRYIDLAGRQIDLTLSSRLIDRLLGLKLSARPNSAGYLMNRLAEFDGIRTFITSATVMAFIDLPFVALFLGLVLWLGGWLVTIPLLCISVSLGIAWVLNRPMQRVIAQQQDVSAQRQNFLMECLLGLVSVKSCNVERQHQQHWSGLNQKVADASLRIRQLQTISTQTATFLLQLNTLVMVIAGVYLISAGNLSMGGLIAMMMISGRCAAPVSQVIGLLNQYEKAIQALTHTGEVMKLPQEYPADRKLLRPASFRGVWHINNLSFAYPGTPDLLRDITLKIPAGARVAILGRMGSGKSTLLQLLMGLWEPSKGHVVVDGIDIRQLDPAWFRQQVGYVGQQADLFNGTLRDNITMHRPGIRDSDILEALEKVGLITMVQSGRGGLDFQVGEGGRHLSGGQAHAVGLARALVTRPRALILDEPTGAMDTQAEARFRKVLMQLDGITLFLVTHKVTLLDVMERIIVLEEGKLRVNDDAQAILSGQVKATAEAVESL
ncbi:ATP-binding cassette domain-containing protein [Kistimonas asteriae]|uniref:ATP-binding cassette domain-containing protein n=1 Tax=Kistimonas asteriae TaxID=517724 RepID=UPI001BABF8DB|nr:ATP-binding cassette domain-containing protein [Kistimonas asteriae]